MATYAINKQLLNEIKYDMRNYQGRDLCERPKLKAQVDNTNRGPNNFSYPTRTDFNNCFIIYLYLYRTPGKRLPFKEDLPFPSESHFA